jgi:hypothetical protein
MSFQQEVMAELILKWRECDSDSIKLLGIGKQLASLFVHTRIAYDIVFAAERSESKTRVLGRLSTVFQCLRQLEEAREQLTMFRYRDLGLPYFLTL